MDLRNRFVKTPASERDRRILIARDAHAEKRGGLIRMREQLRRNDLDLTSADRKMLKSEIRRLRGEVIELERQIQALEGYESTRERDARMRRERIERLEREVLESEPMEDVEAAVFSHWENAPRRTGGRRRRGRRGQWAV